MRDINKFYASLIQEVQAMQQANEEGDTQEQAFTRYVTDLLAEAAETDDVIVAFDEKDLGTKKQHKINAYAINDDYQNLDLFITIFQPTEQIENTPKEKIDQAVTRITNFFRHAVYDHYINDVAESSEIAELANNLDNYKELRESLIRVNAVVLTNGIYKGANPESTEICGYKVFYKIVDLNHIYQISEDARAPIEIDFEEEHFDVPCLPASIENPEYEAYVAIFPGALLASLYERFGSRLLEQNVRSFLQFGKEINRQIRKTITDEPEMFLAFNNGIAATADNIELDSAGRMVKKISNLQIVNGGQTTASIYHTQKKDKADISKIFVQAKISVIKHKENYADIVARISKYANKQNKVDETDFSSNNECLVAIEKISHIVMSPLTASKNMQTYWFFERTKGQYKNLRLKEGFTSAKARAFDLKYPKTQLVDKVSFAKYINAYQEIYDGKKLVVSPAVVAKGNQQNFPKFINYALPSNASKIDNIYYEDSMAKAILWKEADRRYGSGNQIGKIGEFKRSVVPYTICLLTLMTEGKINLYKIWQNQQVSQNLSDFIYGLMKQVHAFMRDNSPTDNVIEWTKKEECWLKIREQKWSVNLDDIREDLIDENNPIKRRSVKIMDKDSDESKHELSIINAIPHSLWRKIAEWGEQTNYLTDKEVGYAREIASDIKYKHKITDQTRRRAMNIYNIVCAENIDLLSEADELSAQEAKEQNITKLANIKATENTTNMPIELIKKMVEWDKTHKILEDWKIKYMKEVIDGSRKINPKLTLGFKQNLDKLKQNGFGENI